MSDPVVRTKLCQLIIDDPLDAPAVFQERRTDGRVPLVLIPRANSCCFSFRMNVPTGVVCLAQEWGRNIGRMDQGLHWCIPAYKKISHIVTVMAVSYNAPVKNCPTQDNVMVEVDISLVFRIGPEVEKCKDFVYNLGAHRFDDLLAATTEEGIRGLVYSVTHDHVLDLREEFAREMLDNLNRRFSYYGVVFTNAKITNVKLPEELARTLQNTTAYKTMNEEEIRRHDTDIQKLRDEAVQRLTAIRKDNERKVLEVIAKKDRSLIEREEKLINAQSKAEVAIMRAEQSAAVKKTQVDASKSVAQIQGQKGVDELLLRTNAECARDRVKAEQDANTARIQSEARKKAAIDRAEALRIEANAEETAASMLKEKRAYDLALHRLSVYRQITASGKMVIAGDTGDKILQAITTGAPLETQILEPRKKGFMG